MNFFLQTQLEAINERIKFLDELIGEKKGVHNKKGLYQAFQKYGVDHSRPRDKQISFRMVEKVVVEQRTLYKGDLGFDQIELILRQVRQLMKVDPISKLESVKMAYGEDEKGYSFVKWLALL